MTSDRIFGAICALFIGCALLLPYVGGYPAAYVTMALILILSVWHYATPWRVPLDPGALLLLLAFGILAIVFAIGARPGTNDALFALNFVLFALYAPLTGALGRVARPGNALTVSWLALASALVALAIAAFQVGVLKDWRAAGFGSNPIPSATAALFLGFLALGGWALTAHRSRWLFLLGPVAGVGTVFLAGSRGPFIALPFLLIVVALFARLSRRAALMLAVLIAAEIALLSLLMPDMMLRFIAVGQAASELAAGQPVDADESSAIRSEMYSSGLRAFLDSPLIGHGWEHSITVAEQYAPGAWDGQKRHFHSDPIGFAASGGVLGLLAYVFALIAPLASVLASPRDGQFAARRYGVLILSVGFFTAGVVNLLFGFEFMTTFYIAIGAILVAWCRDETVGGRP